MIARTPASKKDTVSTNLSYGNITTRTCKMLGLNVNLPFLQPDKIFAMKGKETSRARGLELSSLKVWGQ